jgi:hypothetical protein
MCKKVRLCMFSLSNTNLARLKWSSALHVSYFTPLWIFWRRVMDSITTGILPLIKYRAKKLENDEIVATTANTIETLPYGLLMSANMVCLLYSTTRRRMRLIQRFIRHSSLPQPEPSMGTCIAKWTLENLKWKIHMYLYTYSTSMSGETIIPILNNTCRHRYSVEMNLLF